jgi:hypothetical protein
MARVKERVPTSVPTSQAIEVTVNEIKAAVGEGNYWIGTPEYLSFVWGQQNDNPQTKTGNGGNDFGFLCCDGSSARFSKPVGFLIKGELEITELIDSKAKSSVKRIRTTALVKEGEYFGLFESIANLKGKWRIRAGVANIYISNKLGSSKLWSKLGFISRANGTIGKVLSKYSTFVFSSDSEDVTVDSRIDATFRTKADASYDFSALLKFAIDAQQCEMSTPDLKIMIFDVDKIRDVTLLSNLQKKTIGQLTSVLYQNGLESAFPDLLSTKQLKKLSDKRGYAALVSILRGHTPIFIPILAKNDDFFKLIDLKLPKNKHQSHSSDIHVFKPSYLSSTSSGLLIFGLNNSIAYSDFDDAIRTLKSITNKQVNDRLQLSVDSFENLAKNNKDYGYKVKVNIDSKNFFIYRTDIAIDKTFTKLIARIFETDILSYEWNKTFNQVLIFFPATLYESISQSN